MFAIRLFLRKMKKEPRRVLDTRRGASYNVGRKVQCLLADYSTSNFKQKSPKQGTGLWAVFCYLSFFSSITTRDKTMRKTEINSKSLMLSPRAEAEGFSSRTARSAPQMKTPPHECGGAKQYDVSRGIPPASPSCLRSLSYHAAFAIARQILFVCAPLHSVTAFFALSHGHGADSPRFLLLYLRTKFGYNKVSMCPTRCLKTNDFVRRRAPRYGGNPI